MNYPEKRQPRRVINSEEERLERKRENNRNYTRKHKEAIRKKRTRSILKNYEKYIWRTTKYSAKVRNIEFNIKPEDIIIPEYCTYLGVKLTKIIGEYRGKIDTNASIDRIDNSKGYIKGNIQIISALANKMKSNASIENLIEFARGVLKTHLENS